MVCKDTFKEFNSEINPFYGNNKIVTVFMEGRKKITPEIEYLIFNQARVSAISFYYSMFAQNNHLARENGLKFIFADSKFKLTSVQMLQELCRFKQECYGDLPIFIVMDFTLADSSCAIHSFVKGMKRALADIRRLNTEMNMLFILPSKSPFKVNHDCWLLANSDGLIRKLNNGDTVSFKCTNESVCELRNSIIFRNAFSDLAYITPAALDMDNVIEFSTYLSETANKFERYYDIV